MSSPELDPHLLAKFMEPARELLRQGKTSEEVQRVLIAQGATADEAARIANLARFTETMSQVDHSRQGRPQWMEFGGEWLDGIAWLCILACATLIVSWIVRAVQGAPPSLFSLGGAASGLVFGICLRLHLNWARWTTFIVGLLVFVFLVFDFVRTLATEQLKAFESAGVLIWLGKFLLAVLILLLGLKVSRRT